VQNLSIELRRALSASIAASLLAVLAPNVGAAAPPAGAARVVAEEVRDFEVLVKGKPAGKSQTRITQYDDGSVVATTDATVKLTVVLYVYRYEFHGRETWRGGRLSDLSARATDDGKHFSTRAKFEPSGSLSELNGNPAKSDTPVGLTTNYWQLPDARLIADGFCIMDSDRGTLHPAKMVRVGSEQVAVAGQDIACDHYRTEGSMAADLWFDARGRLVRQQTIEDGYQTELKLTGATRNTSESAAR
jgi:hypothetical protein